MQSSLSTVQIKNHCYWWPNLSFVQTVYKRCPLQNGQRASSVVEYLFSIKLHLSLGPITICPNLACVFHVKDATGQWFLGWLKILRTTSVACPSDVFPLQSGVKNNLEIEIENAVKSEPQEKSVKWHARWRHCLQNRPLGADLTRRNFRSSQLRYDNGNWWPNIEINFDVMPFPLSCSFVFDEKHGSVRNRNECQNELEIGPRTANTNWSK